MNFNFDAGKGHQVRKSRAGSQGWEKIQCIWNENRKEIDAQCTCDLEPLRCLAHNKATKQKTKTMGGVLYPPNNSAPIFALQEGDIFIAGRMRNPLK